MSAASTVRRPQPELLDSLPAGDPRVARCRRDLRLINWLLGNQRWIIGVLRQHPQPLRGGLLELGAGDGTLLKRLRRTFPQARLAGYDLAPRPDELPRSIEWQAGDVLGTAESWSATVLVANLFLHHFTAEQLAALGCRLAQVELLVIGEGHRNPGVIRRSRWLRPLLGAVTRHDMEISLGAGFVAGELPVALGLSADDWQTDEFSTPLGAHRLVALRRSPRGL